MSVPKPLVITKKQNSIKTDDSYIYIRLPIFLLISPQAHTLGLPVARPLFAEFPADKKARDIDDQFMLGHALMVAPILQPDTLNRTVYFPEVMPKEIDRIRDREG